MTSFDSILRHAPFAAAHRPALVVRFGRPPTSKVLAQWVVGSEASVFQVGGPGVIDPDRNVTAFCCLDDFDALEVPCRRSWLDAWRDADRRAEAAIAAELEAAVLTEPAVARVLAEWLPDDAEMVVAASMPMRDLEWFGGPRARAHANRGANGIDGVLSTALGRALASRRTVVAVLGDIAAVHDSNALVGLATRGVDLRVVVVDNDGGGIFSFLPQATALAAERFELLFGTPHATDMSALAAAHRLPCTDAGSPAELRKAVAEPGPSLTRVPGDRADNVAAHDRLHAAVAAALGR